MVALKILKYREVLPVQFRELRIVVNFAYMVEGRDYLKWRSIGVELDNGPAEDRAYILSCKDWKDSSDRECGVRI